MERINVISSNLKSVGYDKSTNILEIEFHQGTVYQYFGVPESIFISLINSSSKGEFHSQFIKDNFNYSKIR